MRRKQVTIIGSSDCGFVHEAYALGKHIAQKGWVLVTGGRGGIMESASKGAREHGGIVVGILPFEEHRFANPYCDIVIPTGIGFARNLCNVLSGDVIVAMGGGAGTLSEIAYAWQFRRPVIACTFIEGWSKKLASEQIDERGGKIIIANSLQEAVNLLDNLILSDAQ
ncbi:MAG: TIGR00725 family protein [Spirochaetes bacterium]|nr:TIGR00725 family protein [Spirochaetota bacterium]